MKLSATYKAEVTADPFGSYIVSFDDVPAAVCIGTDAADALSRAPDVLAAALLAMLAQGRTLPAARAIAGIDITVTIEADNNETRPDLDRGTLNDGQPAQP